MLGIEWVSVLPDPRWAASLMSWIAESLRAHMELALFLALGLGHAVGRLRLGPLKLNPVIGVLLAGVAVGQVGIEVPPALQWSFFVLFLFSVGYKTGPQFFRGLGRGALPQAGLAFLFCATALATGYALSRLFGFTAGGAAGLVAGGLNASAAIGTAGDAIAKLPVSAAVKHELAENSAVAFAVTYLAGMLASIATLSKVQRIRHRRVSCRRNVRPHLSQSGKSPLPASSRHDHHLGSYRRRTGCPPDQEPRCQSCEDPGRSSVPSRVL
jgi:uncharacterized transporter YbjL